MAVQDILSPFVWGQGGAALTPEQIAQRNAVAKGLLASATDTSPTAGGWASILSKALAGGVAGYDMRSADNAEKANQSYNTDLVNSLFGGGAIASAPAAASPASASIPMTGAASEVSGSAPDLTNNQIYNDFIGAVQKGGLTNPNGLAAVAATGNAESGYDPAKMNAAWPDPSQSGQPGTSGGLLSWRNERLANLRNFAQAQGVDPKNIPASVQGQFFLQENPQLVEALNSAKSPQEAASLMANAWRFAGYDQPGGEAARRLASTSAFLPRFQGQPVQVASAAPQTATDAINAVAPQQDAGTAALAYAAPQASTYRDPAVSAINAPAASPAPSAPAQQVAQALMTPQAAPSASAMNPAIVRALTDPRASPQTQAVARALLQQQFAQDQAARQIAAQQNQAIFEYRLKQQDPANQLAIQKAQNDIASFRTPEQQEADSRAHLDYVDKLKQQDPSYQADLQLRQAQLAALQNKPKGEAKVAGNRVIWVPSDGSAPTDITPSAAGAPNGGFRFDGTSIEGQALNGLIDTNKLTVEQAQQLAAGKQITDPATGALVFLTPQNIFGSSAGASQLQPQAPQGIDIFAGQSPQQEAPQAQAQPQSQPAPAQQAPVIPQPVSQPQSGPIPLTPPRAASEAEKSAAGYADRMADAQAQLAQYEDQGLNGMDQFLTTSRFIPSSIGNHLVGSDFQLFDQARRNFSTAQLRRESGAVIGQEEQENANKQYFPQPGDSKEVIAQKRLNRQRAVDAMIRDAGPTYKPPAQNVQNDALSQARDAIKQGASREAVIKRLRENGIDPTGL